VAIAVVALAAVPAAAAPGDLDTSFGVGGVLTTNFGGTYDWAYAVAVQRDGRIVAAGVSNAGKTYDFALARYTADRSLDPTFGGDGTVTTDFGGSYDWAYALALQPDGKIVVGGVSDRSGNKGFALARYLPNGALDGSFGEGGLVTGSLRPLTVDAIRGVALQPDGRIIAAGITFENEVSLRPHGDFMVARYLPDGQPDLTFGVAGMVTTDFESSSYDELYALALQPDGRILTAGVTDSGGGPGILLGADDLALARYTAEGILDADFGRGGKAVLDLGSRDEEIRALALAPDGKIVVAGYRDGERQGDLMLGRLDRQGVPDAGFGEKGFAFTDSGSRSRLERLSAVAMYPGGMVVAGGQVARGERAAADFALVRYDPRGKLDSTFGRNGLVTVDLGGREDRIHGLAIQSDGKVVVAGSSENDFALARFQEH